LVEGVRGKTRQSKINQSTKTRSPTKKKKKIFKRPLEGIQGEKKISLGLEAHLEKQNRTKVAVTNHPVDKLTNQEKKMKKLGKA